MAYLEKNFQTDFNKYAKHLLKRTAAYELKISNGGSIPFTDVKEHQQHALLAAKHDSLIFKIPDAGYQNPFDSFQLHGVDAWVVIMFYAKERNRKEFVMIDVDTWLEESKTSKRKSLTLERAREIGEVRFLN